MRILNVRSFLVASAVLNSLVTNAQDIAGLGNCTLSSLELSQLKGSDELAPCLLYDEGPEASSEATVVTLVQVTPAMCKNHRDGAVTAIEKLNGANGGKGIAVGSQSNTSKYVQFRLLSAIAGNSDKISGEEYATSHEELLTNLISTYNAGYIIGSCSFAAEYDKAPALQAARMVLAQIGPPNYYSGPTSNEYVFGMHVNSDTYPLAAIKGLQFSGATQDQQVRVVYRDRSEFFYSTCQSAINKATAEGFDTKGFEYNPEGDDDGNGVLNSNDVVFLQNLADEACPPNASSPALFACTLTELETNTLLDRWAENGCRPASVWLTPATWGWASNNKERLPLIQGGGQWHPAMSYADDYFTSGQAVLDYNEKVFGYAGDYNTIVSYAIPMVFAQNIESTFRLDANPDFQTAFGTPEGYGTLVDNMKRMDINTIYGPVKFNQFQRNNGRGGAATQWDITGSKSQLVAPLAQAEVSMTVPSPSSEACLPGSFVDEKLLAVGTPILTSKCVMCPVDSFTSAPNHDFECAACENGSTTLGEMGASFCALEGQGTTNNTALIAGLVGGIGGAIILLLLYLVYRSHKVTQHIMKLEKEGKPVPRRVSSIARLSASMKSVQEVVNNELAAENAAENNVP